MLKSSILDLIGVNISKEIHKESVSNSQIGAFFLTHAYIEEFLKALFILPENYGKLSKEQRKILLSLKYFNFSSLLNHQLSLGILSDKEFRELLKLNQLRNRIGHHLISHKQNKNFRGTVTSSITRGIDICESLQTTFSIRLNSIYSDLNL